MPDTDRSTTVAAVRDFNRAYTRTIGLLEESITGSPFTLPEARVLYELAHDEALGASILAERLSLDTGYVSRLVTRLVRRGLVKRAVHRTDRRRAELLLTAKGRRAFAALDRDTESAIGALVEPLDDRARRDLVQSLARVRQLLVSPGDDTPSSSPIVLRSHRPGDLTWIAHRQTMLYVNEYRWNGEFEAVVSRIFADFIDHYDPTAEQCWVAERDGVILGSVSAMRKSRTVCQLRMLYVEQAARGLGIGRLLVRECVAFARRAGYRSMTLWTVSILSAARRIYEAEGFVLAKEAPEHRFGQDLIAQTWELVL
jgi:DNA-binding MarR family transcriptional regulator/GNAT superfamily N-acetyltransferase